MKATATATSSTLRPDARGPERVATLTAGARSARTLDAYPSSHAQNRFAGRRSWCGLPHEPPNDSDKRSEHEHCKGGHAQAPESERDDAERVARIATLHLAPEEPVPFQTPGRRM